MRREFRVSYMAVRVFVAASMADAIRQAEAAGATDITGILRGAEGAMDITGSRLASENEAVVVPTRRQRLALADQELTEVSDRLQNELRKESPELFDARGRLRKRVASARIVERIGGRTWLSASELMALQAANYVETAY
jgi:hypothetical protein